MTYGQLLKALKGLGCRPETEVYFVVPEEEDMTTRECLTAYRVNLEYAHDEDCMPFVRVSLEDKFHDAE